MKSVRIFLLTLAVFIGISSIRAQQVNTLYFLENAPMRHTINPAFQPVSDFYLPIPIIGYFNVTGGNNQFMLKDLYFNDPTTNNMIGALHPNAQSQVWNNMTPFFRGNTEVQFTLLSWGWRFKENGYFHVNSSERVELRSGIPTSLFGQMLNPSLEQQMDLTRLTAVGDVYSELALGYSHRINEKWTVGGKVKVLFGHAHANADFNNLNLEIAGTDAKLFGSGNMVVAGAVNSPLLYGDVTKEDYLSTIWTHLIPSGYGGALDLGFTYKPIQQLQISAAVTDLGFMHWHQAEHLSMTADTTFTQLGGYDYNNYVQNGVFDADSMLSAVDKNIDHVADAIIFGDAEQKAYTNMLTAKLNIGIDANFFKNKLGVGVYSHTRFYNSYITEEITLGAAYRPANWFNIAASYSFINGHWSNLGAAISLATYDGIMFTVAADYIPLSYAKATYNDKALSMPYKTNQLNLSVGVTIVTGTNKPRKKSKAEETEEILMTPIVAEPITETPVETEPVVEAPAEVEPVVETPVVTEPVVETSVVTEPVVETPVVTEPVVETSVVTEPVAETPVVTEPVQIIEIAPIDSDNDGITDEFDKCPSTPAGVLVDTCGCPLDDDHDGVPNYLDKCPNTPAEVAVDSVGCPLDDDHDGVPNYLDYCPETPVEAQNQVDENGCPLDSDKDGVANYEDLCPDTPGEKSNKGCPVVIQEVREMIQKKMAGIEFDFEKAIIRPDSYNYLNQIAQTFIANPSYMVDIQGHTSSEGKYSFNMKLSEQRAVAVREYLIKKGVPASMLTTQGFGPNKPISTNATLEGRRRNRRVEFVISYEETTRTEVNNRVEK